MLAALQKKDWKVFARLYNGPAYAQNRHDGKLSKAYSSFSKQHTGTVPLGGPPVQKIAAVPLIFVTFSVRL